ncbi:MAG: hypothetical protein K2X86_17350, partial [Cytophagaceae bacterium]|nr:hypothetical protein [Cytophagaceae bacterium]
AILYIIFFAKRRQRPIAIMESKVNTSLEFIKTVGTLYFTQKNHFRLVNLKMKLFLNFIRDRYHLATNTMNEELSKKIALKSGLPEENIKTIFNKFRMLEHKRLNVTADDLINFHNDLDNFYKNCK